MLLWGGKGGQVEREASATPWEALGFGHVGMKPGKRELSPGEVLLEREDGGSDLAQQCQSAV